MSLRSRLIVVMAVLEAVGFAFPARAGLVDSVKEWFFDPGEKKKPQTVEQEGADGDVSGKLFPDDAIVGLTVSSIRVPENGAAAELTIRRSTSFGLEAQVSWETVSCGSSGPQGGPTRDQGSRAGFHAGGSLDAGGGERRLSDQANGCATPGKDFAPGQGVAMFGPKETEKLIRIPILDDAEHEGPEGFDVVLKDPRGARIDPKGGRAHVVIDDDDPPPPPPNPAVLVPQPDVLAFGSVEAFQSAVREMMWVNQGGRPARIESLDLVPANSAYAITANDCTKGRYIDPGKTCSVGLVFRPSSDGPVKAVLKLSATDGDKGLSADLALGGMGAAPPEPPDPMVARVEQAREYRKQSAGIRTLVKPPPVPEEPKRWKMTDEDYKKIKLGRSYFTFPVDRERIITTDRFIPCVLETAINSSIQGGVICVVESPVYGSDFRRVLIPSGTRVEGDYIPLSKQGETRLNVIWRRFMRPDGSSIYIKTGFQGMDITGKTGVPGEIDNRWWEKYGTAILMTSLSAVGSAAMPSSEKMANASATFADSMSKITSQMLEENLDLRPVITVAAGTRLTIRPLTDLWFPVPELMTSTQTAEEQGAQAGVSEPPKNEVSQAQNAGSVRTPVRYGPSVPYNSTSGTQRR